MILSDFVLRKAKRACAMRRATSDTAFKMVCRDRRMDRGARLGVNQGEAEGVDYCPPMRDNLSSYVCKKIVKKLIISKG